MSTPGYLRPASSITAVGGVGGSGTRVVADIVNRIGFAFAPDLNEALDNLWFTLLFKYREAYDLDSARFAQLYGAFGDAMSGRNVSEKMNSKLIELLLSGDRAGQHSQLWVRERLQGLLKQGCGSTASEQGTAYFFVSQNVSEHSGMRSGVDAHVRSFQGTTGWGWKEPNTHIFIDRLISLEPRLRYIHLVRSGLDMAFSRNRNQLRLWGPLVLRQDYEDSPRGALRFWRWANERVLELRNINPDRILLVSFERLCHAPGETIAKIAEFLGQAVASDLQNALASAVKTPATIDRFISEDDLDPDDIAFAHYLSSRTLGNAY